MSKKLKKKIEKKVEKGMKKHPIWIVLMKSESGDEYGPYRFDSKPTLSDISSLIEKTGEELHCGGPGDFGSYVRYTVHKL